MALTHELAERQSPVFEYIHRRFPVIDGTKRGAPFARELQQIFGFGAVPKVVLVNSRVQPAQRNTVGTAFDYRARYHLGVFPVDDTVAAQGAANLLGVPEGRVAHGLARQFFEGHEQLLRRLCPRRTRLTSNDEYLLARNCVVLAYYEQIFRAGPAIRSPLYELRSNASVEDLLALVPNEMTEDVQELAHAFEEDFRSLADADCILNPNFEGSLEIGGADADLLLNDTLYELKVMTNFDSTNLRGSMCQLLGYVLLDYRDSFCIRNVSIYLPRQRYLWRAPIWQLLLSVDDVIALSNAGKAPDVAIVQQLLGDARRDFRKIVASLRTA